MCAELYEISKNLYEISKELYDFSAEINGLTTHANLLLPIARADVLAYVALNASGLASTVQALRDVLADTSSAFCATRTTDHIEPIQRAVDAMPPDAVLANHEQDPVLLLSKVLTLERESRRAAPPRTAPTPDCVSADLVRFVLAEMGPVAAKEAIDKLVAGGRSLRPPSEEQVADHRAFWEA